MFNIYVSYKKSGVTLNSYMEQLILSDLKNRIDCFKKETLVIFSTDNDVCAVGLHLQYLHTPGGGMVLVSGSLVSKDGSYREETFIECTLNDVLTGMSKDYVASNRKNFSKNGIKISAKKAIVINVMHNLTSKYYIITNNDAIPSAIKRAKNLYEDINLVPLGILEKTISASDPENPSVGNVDLSVEPFVLANITEVNDWLIQVQIYFSHIHVAWSRNGYASKYTVGIDTPYKADVDTNFWLTKYVSALTCIYDNIPVVSRDEELRATLCRYFKDLISNAIAKINFQG